VFANADLIGSVNTRNGILENDLPSLNRTMGVARQQLKSLRRALEKERDSLQASKLRDQIKPREEYLRTMSRLRIKAPWVGMNDGLVIQDGNRRVRLVYLGVGHTDGDIVLLLPELKIAFLGDLLFNKAVPNVQDGDILQWMKTLERVLKLDADILVPGHGPVGSKKDVGEFLAYFRDLKSLVQSAIDRGDSIEQATRDIRIPGKYAAYRFQNLFPANVQKMYTELKALKLLDEPEEDRQGETAGPDR
jgi:glyoxylase-like metal-dependent hydrolase (beta-lactamase superfamily II)